ncbi:MAG: DUF3734 domain-containing protein [Burkholderiaceae bacterium]
MNAARSCARYDEVALVLQGGGALGSYQAGVVEGLGEAGIEPTWVAGISIGAINAAIIAGNAPDQRTRRLEAFWQRICRQPGSPGACTLPQALPMPEAMRTWMAALASWRALTEGQNGFFWPRFAPPVLPGTGSAQSASWYDTAALRETLEHFVDFDRLNHPSAMRVSVGAVQVATGNMRYFDNRRERLGPEHFMASGALPPGFPAVVVDDEAYWDGGLVSNTPLLEVLRSGRPDTDLLVFQVDLWGARGAVPTSLIEVSDRQKDIQYSSRTRMVTDLMGREIEHRRQVSALLALLPPEHRQRPLARRAARFASPRRCNVIHLIYQRRPREGLTRDFEFSARTMRMHWREGLDDARRTLRHPQWLVLPGEDSPFVTHDIHRRVPAALPAAP